MIIEKLSKRHKRESFDCGNELLNIFLKKYACQNQYRYFVGVTYVIHENNRVIGYITISASSIKKTSLDVKKPYDDVPVLRIGRLAVDTNYQGKKIGERLLKFGIEKALELKEYYGCTGIVVDVKEDAIDFYKNYGFVTMQTLEKHLTTPMYLSIKAIENLKM